MNFLLALIAGYCIHDAIQPTAVGQLLDKVALPADLLVAAKTTETQES